MQTYLFYDMETTGLNRAFDQILQFAAVRTDMNFKEIDRHEIAIRLRPDIVISPRALITHRIPIQKALSGDPEFDAVRRMHRLFNEPETISLGYNSLRFDDEFLRFAFYRNLLPAYTHQYANGCRRMDILPMTVLYSLYKRDILTWPDDNGKASLKLEDLSAANNLAKGRAHDAMTDVEATVGLARRLAGSRDMWAYLSDAFVKDIDQARADQLPVAFESPAGTHRLGLMTGSEFGTRHAYQVPVVSIGRSIPYANQSLWLRLDLPELQDAGPDTVADTTWVIRKRFGEPGILLPPYERYWQTIDPERRQVAHDNLAWLQSNPRTLEEIVAYHRAFEYPVIPSLDAEAALYQAGFPPRETEALCRRFHASAANEKAALVASFPDTETRVLAGRIMVRHFPEYAPDEAGKEYAAYMARINPQHPDDAMPDYRGEKRVTPSSALADIDQLNSSADLDDEQAALLKDLERYIMDHFRS